MEQGPTEQTIIRQAMRSGLPLPKAIQNAPELEQRLELYYHAYTELDSCRQIGWNLGPIPWTAIRQYCEMEELEGDQQMAMFYHIRAMDVAYLTHLKKKRGKK